MLDDYGNEVSKWLKEATDIDDPHLEIYRHRHQLIFQFH